jgi:hypothetical protein
MPFVSSLRKQTATVSKAKLQKIKKVLVDTDFVHLHNHTILRFTIDNKYSAAC